MFLPIGDENPTERRPFVNYTLIALNIVAFLALCLGSPNDPAFIRWTMIPAQLDWTTLFTSLFLHAGWMHLLGNMLFLWIFGDNVEDRLGHVGYIVFYFVCGLAADAAHILSNPHSEIPTLGASGAISGVMGAYILFYPRHQVKTFIWLGIWYANVVRTPAWIWIGVWFGQQILLNLLSPQGGGGVAYLAHIGGFVSGLAIAGAVRAALSAWRGGSDPAAEGSGAGQRKPFFAVPDDPDLEWLDEPGDSYSVLRLDEDPAVLESIGEVVEGLTGEATFDVKQRLESTRGMIARQVSRETAAFDPITTLANTASLCTTTSADPLARTPSQCLLRGFPGTYTRLTAEARWRKSFTDPFGQIWTPFAILRADAINSSVSNQPGVSNFLPVGDTQALRPMPAVGLEYRYPFINVQPWGTTTIEPIAQIIARPNETYAGKLPNEDAQSMVFDASNLFAIDKFSGYDRVEGGGRANVGVQATTQFDRGGSINVLVGQSYQLYGLNSYAVKDATNTGLDSGLQNARSDYVARINYSPNRTYTFSVRTRMDEATQNINRFEAEGRAAFDRWSVSMIYGNYAAQPELGYLTRREGLLGSASVKVASNWVVSGSARWDLEANKLNQYIVGAGYVDDCFVLAANYVTSYSYSAGTTPPVLSHAFMLQIGLRTLANSSSTAGGGGIQ